MSSVRAFWLDVCLMYKAFCDTHILVHKKRRRWTSWFFYTLKLKRKHLRTHFGKPLSLFDYIDGSRSCLQKVGEWPILVELSMEFEFENPVQCIFSHHISAVWFSFGSRFCIWHLNVNLWGLRKVLLTKCATIPTIKTSLSCHHNFFDDKISKLFLEISFGTFCSQVVWPKM